MITVLKGDVAAVKPDSVTVVTYGVGRKVHVTPSLASHLRPGHTVDLHTFLVVREDSLTLFGFETESERDLFETLQTISGIGPRLALAILSVLTPSELAEAVSAGDEKVLTTVPGIGKKVAARLMLELTGKLAAVPVTTPGGAPAPGTVSTQVVEALVNLGWKPAAAEDAVATTAAQMPEADTPTLLRAVLKSLGARR